MSIVNATLKVFLIPMLKCYCYSQHYFLSSSITIVAAKKIDKAHTYIFILNTCKSLVPKKLNLQALNVMNLPKLKFSHLH